MNSKTENKREKFERIAEYRVNEVIRKIRLVGNLSNSKNYDYDQEHVDEIMNTMENELKLLKNKFQEESKENQTAFSFSKKVSNK